MTTWTWLAVAVAAWTGLAVVIGVVIGRTVRVRNRQVPEPGDDR